MSAASASCFEAKGATQVFRQGVTEALRQGGAAWVTTVAVMLAPTALVVAGQYLIWHTGAGELMETMQKGALDAETLDPGELFGGIGLMVGVGAVSGILSFLATYAAGAAVARMMAERALGRPFSPAQAWDFALGRIGKIISGGFVLLLIIVAAAIAGEIPGGIVGAVVGMSGGPLEPGAKPPAIMQIAPLVTMAPVLAAAAVYLAAMMAVTGIENQGGFTALGRSSRLAAGQFWHVLGVLALAAVCFMAPSMAVGMMAQTSLATQLRESLGPANGMLVLTGVSSALSLLLSPFALTVQAALYFDLRARQREGVLPADELARDMGVELPEAAAQAIPPAERGLLPDESDSEP